MRRILLLRLSLGLLVIALSSPSFAEGESSASQALQSQESRTHSTRTLTIENGTRIEVESGFLRIPESRSKATDRVLSLPYYRFRTEADKPAAPVFVLAGGPGSSWIERVERQENFEEVRFYQSFADVVIFDQRGGGTSSPAMECRQQGSLPVDEPLNEAEVERVMVELAEQCRDQWLGEGFDLKAK